MSMHSNFSRFYAIHKLFLDIDHLDHLNSVNSEFYFHVKQFGFYQKKVIFVQSKSDMSIFIVIISV